MGTHSNGTPNLGGSDVIGGRNGPGNRPRTADRSEDLTREFVFNHGYSTAEAGFGYGHSIVDEIVDLHGWEVELEKSADGGTRLGVTGFEYLTT